MKITRAEKLWLGIVAVLFILYNIPGIPAYGDSRGAIIHGAILIIALYAAVYIGYWRVNKVYKLRKGVNRASAEAKPETEEEGE